ncbi:MAG: PHP domain-containing protein, partial [Clostridiales bacterium]|nr:PHP domain-containing protein [Clostridiales bacterium]
TVYFHGKGTVLDNAIRAKQLGLKQIGITDHGFSHLAFAMKRQDIPALVRDCKAAESVTGIKVLAGLENNILGLSGKCDFTKEDYEHFDLFLAGVHVHVKYEHGKDRKIGIWSMLRTKFNIKPSASLIKYTTQAYINAVKNNPIDVITHLNFRCFADAVEVAKCCRDYGTYLEISSKKSHLTDEELQKVADTGVRFLINSDAHSIDRVGDTALAETQIMRVGIPLSQIDNIEGRMPEFRFAEYKKHL